MRFKYSKSKDSSRKIFFIRKKHPSSEGCLNQIECLYEARATSRNLECVIDKSLFSFCSLV